MPKYKDSIFTLTQQSQADQNPMDFYKEETSLYIIQTLNGYNIQLEEQKKYISKRQEGFTHVLMEKIGTTKKYIHLEENKIILEHYAIQLIQN